MGVSLMLCYNIGSVNLSFLFLYFFTLCVGRRKVIIPSLQKHVCMTAVKCSRCIFEQCTPKHPFGTRYKALCIPRVHFSYAKLFF